MINLQILITWGEEFMRKKLRLFIIALSISCLSCNFVSVYAEGTGDVNSNNLVKQVSTTGQEVMENGDTIKYVVKEDGTVQITKYIVSDVTRG